MEANVVAPQLAAPVCVTVPAVMLPNDVEPCAQAPVTVRALSVVVPVLTMVAACKAPLSVIDGAVTAPVIANVLAIDTAPVSVVTPELTSPLPDSLRSFPPVFPWRSNPCDTPDPTASQWNP